MVRPDSVNPSSTQGSNMNANKLALTISLLLCPASLAIAHDTWVQTNAPLVRAGDVVHIDLMLGNHGNEHRDFKLAGKVNPDWCTLEVIAPSGKRYDVKDRLVDRGYAPQEGFWSTRFAAAEEGLHVVAHTLDTLHRTTHAIKSSKAYFAASRSLDKLDLKSARYSEPLGLPIELVPQTNPLALAPGKPISVRLLYQGKPLAGTRVSFIPRGAELTAEFDERYERLTDADGCASFTPTEGNVVLVVAHHAEPEQQGEGFDRTHYSATLVLHVPQVCACCDP
jgi:uncharacterized GH25 family protein